MATLDFIKEIEGFSPFPYQEEGRVPTIGYGCAQYTSGKRVKLDDPPISEAVASIILLHYIENKIVPGLLETITVDLSMNQLVALISLMSTVNVKPFLKSRLVKMINKNPNDPKIIKEWRQYVYLGQEPDNDLMLRRELEIRLYYK